MDRARAFETDLTARQREVLRLIGRGHTNGEIAEELGISLAGAKWHVSELLLKFNVDSRDELADLWAKGGGRSRLSRTWAGITGLVALRPAIAAATAGLVVGGAGFAAIGISVMGGAGSETPDDVVSAVATATPIPTATLPAAPGAVWTADEALQRAEIVAREALDDDLNADVTYGGLDLTRAEWLPDTSELPGWSPNLYWKPEAAPTADVWLFEFRTTGSVVSHGATTDPAIVETQVVLIDGGLSTQRPAEQHRFTDPLTGQASGGAGGFHSRQADADMARRQVEMTPAGEHVFIGWFQDLEGVAPIEGYPSAAGNWCVLGYNADRLPGASFGCQPDFERQNEPIHRSISSTFSPEGAPGEITVWLHAAADVVEVGIRAPGRPEIRYATYAAPVETAIERRFAWLNAGKQPADWLLVGYDASGREVALEPVEALKGWAPPTPHP